MLFTARWWKDALVRAGRTAIIFAIPFFPAWQPIGEADYATSLLTAGLGAVTSLVTSLRGLPETNGVNVSKWRAIVTRCAISLGQGIATGIGAAAILTDVDWGAAFQLGAAGVVGSLLLGILTALPETSEVVTPLPDTGVPGDTVATNVVVVEEGAEIFTAPEPPTPGVV